MENEPLLEPAISPDDTQPRKPVAPIQEPPPSLEDTQPRPVVAEPVDAAPDIADAADTAEEAPAGGCSNPLLIIAVVMAFACLFVSSIGLAAYAGWRDGAESAQTKKAGTLVSYLGNQATLARGDCDEGRYELCNERCQYVATQQPSFPGMASCMTLAQLALSATPTPSATPTMLPPTPTPSQTPTANVGGLPSPEELFARSQEAIRTEDYESAMKWLEALRGRDADFRRKDVEDMLVKTYLALAGPYKVEKRFSEMIIVVKKAAKIRTLDGDWDFTAKVAQMYLDAKAALDAQNYALADKDFSWLIENAPLWEDTRELACKTFNLSGDTAQIKKHCS